MLSRRGFLNLTIGGVVAGAAVRTWPFRVFSFPTEIARPIPLSVYGSGGGLAIAIWYMNKDQRAAFVSLADGYKNWRGIAYNRVNSTEDTWANLKRSTYPATVRIT